MSDNDIIDKCCICGCKAEIAYVLDYKCVIGMADEYRMEINICKNCDYIFLRNPFNQEKLYDRYKNNSKFEFDNVETCLEDRDDYAIRSKRQKEFIERSKIGYRSVLEIGAASGYNLSLYQNEGVETYGVEPSPINCKNARLNYNINLYNGSFDEYYTNTKNKKKYDLVILSHTLEHIVNPCNFIKKISQINGEYVLIEVPTFDYKMSNEPFGMFCEEHVNMFTLKSLQALMNKCGYGLINAELQLCLDQKLPAGFPSIVTIWDKKKRYYKIINDVSKIMADYINDSEKEIGRINNIIDSIPDDKRIALWGTGHHFSMLSANTNLLKKRIVAIFDSDIRKEGIGVYGHQIVPFDKKYLEKIDAVIILSFVAQDVIYKKLEPYKEDIEIVKLYP